MTGRRGVEASDCLNRKRKLGILEEAVGEDDEFSHEDGEVRFFGFADGEEALVENFQDGIVMRGYQGGHVENGADIGTTASERALDAELAAVVVESQSADRGELRFGLLLKATSGCAKRAFRSAWGTTVTSRSHRGLRRSAWRRKFRGRSSCFLEAAWKAASQLWVPHGIGGFSRSACVDEPLRAANPAARWVLKLGESDPAL